jgi:hypothetical protein
MVYTQGLGMHKPPKQNRNGIAGERSLLRSDTRKTCPNVADDSSLRQAIRLKLKGMKRARQDRQPSLTRRQVTRLQLKTIVERSTAVMPLCKARRELSH